MNNIPEQSVIRIIFEYEFRRGRVLSEIVHNIDEVFGPKTIEDRTANKWFVELQSKSTQHSSLFRRDRPDTSLKR